MKKQKVYMEIHYQKLLQDRLDKELNSIINNGYAVMYIIAQKLVTKSIKRWISSWFKRSVGSSFVATMSDITEVNPLPPHYICETKIVNIHISLNG